MTWRVHEVAAAVRLQVTREIPQLDTALNAEVDRLWGVAQARMQGRLFNGQVFSADVISPGLISGHWSEFRRVVAQMEDSGLHARLRVRPTAINGVIEGPDGVVLGRRPTGALYQAGEWQTAPAGSIDPGACRDGEVDPVRQLLNELEEEIGLPADAVHDPRPLCLVEHPLSHVLDLGIAVRTGLEAAPIRAAHATGGNGEYASLEIVAAADVPAFVAQAGDAMTGQARIFLARMGFCATDALPIDS